MSLEMLRERLEAAAGWEQRAAVYREISTRSDPNEALQLLDALRRQTRNGNDLFFIREAAGRLGRDHLDLARPVDELRERFFDHIPPPPESLYRWIETPQSRTAAWREIPPGRFLMGSLDSEGQEDERPRHAMEIERAFRIGTGPVTRSQYAAFDPGHLVQAWEGAVEEELAHHPAAGVTWFAAKTFCDWLSQAFVFTRGARLPGEEEWEYACRAGTETLYWSGHEEAELAAVGWYRGNSGKRTHRIGEKPANDWGLFDTHGNVREWTASTYRRDYACRLAGSPLPAQDLETALDCKLVLRGGGFWDEAPYTRSAIRCVRCPGVCYLTVGFRIALPCLASPCLSSSNQ